MDTMTTTIDPSDASERLQAADQLRVTTSAGRLLGQSFRIYVRNFVPFIVLSAMINLPSLLLALSARGEPNAASIKFVLDLVMGNLAAAAMTYGVVMQLRGQPASLGASIVVGLRRLLPVIGVGLLWMLVVGVGFALLWVPGMILLCMLYVATPAAVIERPGILGALRRSRELTKGFKWTIFAAQFILGLIFMLPMVVVGIVIGRSGAALTTTTAVVLLWAAGLLVSAWGSVMHAVTYHELRLIKEGVDTEELAKVFD